MGTIDRTARTPRVGVTLTMLVEGKATHRTARVEAIGEHLLRRPDDSGEWIQIATHLGWVTYGRLTGTTRHVWGMDCPIVESYDVDTVAESDGAIWGHLGAKSGVRWICRPDAL